MKDIQFKSLINSLIFLIIGIITIKIKVDTLSIILVSSSLFLFSYLLIIRLLGKNIDNKEETKEIICSYCGYSNKKNFYICTKCGRKLK